MTKTNSVFLVAWFSFGEANLFERLVLQHIFSSEEEALGKLSFCDEAGYYEGVLIEERAIGVTYQRGKRLWLLQNKSNGMLNHINEPERFKSITYLIGT